MEYLQLLTNPSIEIEDNAIRQMEDQTSRKQDKPSNKGVGSDKIQMRKIKEKKTYLASNWQKNHSNDA